jgi:hypothetical protein
MASLYEDWEAFRHEPEQFIDAGECLGYVSYHDRGEALKIAGVEELPR